MINWLGNELLDAQVVYDFLPFCFMGVAIFAHAHSIQEALAMDAECSGHVRDIAVARVSDTLFLECGLCVLTHSMRYRIFVFLLHFVFLLDNGGVRRKHRLTEWGMNR